MITLERNSYIAGRFEAMNSPCEILLDTTDAALGAQQLDAARREAGRIEKKYSRYLQGNIVERINRSQGKNVEVDEETAALLDYAAECYDLSDGLFDITTGALRNAGAGFDGLRLGWNHLRWERPFLQMPAGFEIDFGGIGKEYAADRILRLLRKRHAVGTLVNLGGDIAAAGARMWEVGIEDALRPGAILRTVPLSSGALATSGVTKRRGHILNPKTGRPVRQPPASVTVAAGTCTEAGFWSTLAILQGPRAEAFLKEQAITSWCYRPC